MKVLTQRCLFFLLLVTIGHQSFGQDKGAVSGKIVNAKNNKALEFVNIAIKSKTDTTFQTGTTSELDGTFTIENLPLGTYTLEVFMVGFAQKSVRNIKLTSNKPTVRLKNVKMKGEVQQLEEVVVTAEARKEERFVENTIDGMKVNPEQNISQVGGNAADILENVPSVSVDADGNVSLRGASAGGTNVLINGKNSGLGNNLQAIPASAIESISIINTPGSKYDAEGVGGIIDIKLKKGIEKGTKGKIDLAVGNRNRFNGSVNINHRTEKFNFFGGYDRRAGVSLGTTRINREILGDQPEFLDQSREYNRRDLNNNFRIGSDYYINDYNQLSLEFNFSHRTEDITQATQSRLLGESGQVNNFNIRSGDEEENNYNVDQSLSYIRKFQREGQELSASASLSYQDNFEQELSETRQFVTGETSLGYSPSQQRNTTLEDRYVGVIQIDYKQPLLKNASLEAGFKNIFRKFDNDFTFENYEYSTATYTNDEAVSNVFIYQDQVYAGYATFNQSWEKFTLSIGSRLEQTSVQTTLENTNENNKSSYINLFPNFKAQYFLTPTQSVKAMYSRRINRPRAWRLNPFPDVSDSLNIRTGNPNLMPEYVDMYEVGYNREWKNSSFTANLFYRNISGDVGYITRIDENGIGNTRPENLNNARTYGLELISALELREWWNLNANASFFRREIDGSNINAGFQNQNMSWSAKVVSDFTLPFDFTLQLTGNYTAPSANAQGNSLERYYIDLGLQKKILGEKGTLSLNVRDLFNTLQWSGTTIGENFRQTQTNKRETRILMVRFGYQI